MKENKFFAVYGTIMAIGILGSGFFLFKSWSGDRTQLAQYEETANKVKLLKGKKLFPNSANLVEKKAQVADYVAKSDALRDKLLASQRELKTVTKQEFPNILLSTNEKTADFAGSKGIELPEDFYLGMEIYKNGLPPEKAVSVLEWQLDGINTFVNILLEAGVISIDKIVRERLDVELRESADDKKSSGRGSGENRGGERTTDVSYEPDAVLDAYRFNITITAHHNAFVEALNRISNDPSFFFWTRFMRVENEQKQGPLRNEEFTPRPAPVLDEPRAAIPDPEPEPAPDEAAPADPAEADPAVAPEGEDVPPVDPALVEPEVFAADEFVESGATIDVREIFGTEKIKAILFVDLVRFKPKAKEDGGDETPK